jgi:hypothetical protein
MASLTDFRTNVQSTLALALGITFESGILEGPIEDRTVGCCWSEGKREWAQDVNLEEILLKGRVLLQWKQQQGLNNLQLSTLEELLEDVQAALKPIQVSSGPWQFRLSEIEIVYEQNGVEFSLSALQANLFAIGG